MNLMGETYTQREVKRLIADAIAEERKFIRAETKQLIAEALQEFVEERIRILKNLQTKQQERV